MDKCREFFPAKVIPKQHILEVHIVEWLSRWNTGLGLHSEHGVEQTHATFNRLKESFTSIRNPLTKLLCIMGEHHVRTSPRILCEVPKQKYIKLFDSYFDMFDSKYAMYILSKELNVND